MFRVGVSRAGFRVLPVSWGGNFLVSRNTPTFTSKLCTVAKSRPNAVSRHLTLVSIRGQSTSRGPMDNVDEKHEQDLAMQKLKPHPEAVSTTSSTHPLFGEVGQEDEQDKDTDMMAGVKHDIQTIKETFSLAEVPHEAYRVGMAGVLPYMATSLSTVYCAWEINHAAATGTGLLMSEHTAELALHVIEPLQVGYGAVIISFLGAIHWGLEWAGFGGHQGYPRYAIGVIAPAVAWPTILLPVEHALITQFLAFNFLYYTDSRATRRGWAPAWYAVYRFVLTFVVGSAIVISLVGRGQISDRIGKMPGPADRVRALREAQVGQLEKEEEERRANTVATEEDEEAEDESADNE